MEPQSAQAPPRCTKCTPTHHWPVYNFVLFDVALLPLESKGLKSCLYLTERPSEPNDDNLLPGLTRLLGTFYFNSGAHNCELCQT